MELDFRTVKLATGGIVDEDCFRKAISKFRPKQIIFTDRKMPILIRVLHLYIKMNPLYDYPVGWMEGRCLVVSSQCSGEKIEAPIDMSYFFYDRLHFSHQFLIYIDVSNLDVGETKYFNKTFAHCGEKSKSFYIDGLETWYNSYSAIEMNYTFYFAGAESENFSIKGLEQISTFRVETMDGMLYGAGRKCKEWALDLSNLWVDDCISHNHFCDDNSQILEPHWKNTKSKKYLVDKQIDKTITLDIHAVIHYHSM